MFGMFPWLALFVWYVNVHKAQTLACVQRALACHLNSGELGFKTSIPLVSEPPCYVNGASMLNSTPPVRCILCWVWKALELEASHRPFQILPTKFTTDNSHMCHSC